MIAPDTRTVFLALLLTALLMSALMVAFRHVLARTPGISLWAAANVLLTASFFLFVLRGLIPDSLSIVTANLFLTAGALSFLAGAARFVDVRLHVLELVLPMAWVAVLIPVFTYIEPDINLRGLVMSSMASVVSGRGAWLWFVQGRRLPGAPIFYYVLGGTFLLTSIVNVVRLVKIWQDPTPLAVGLMSPGPEMSWFFLSVLLFMVVWNISFLSLANQRTAAQLRLANEGLEQQVLTRTRDLMIAKDDAEQASVAKSRFLAAMSHELRTPLNAIIGFSDIIAKNIYDDVKDPRYQAYASDIYTSGQHLLGIINDILDVSRIEAGVMRLHATSVSVPRLVGECVQLVHAHAQATGVDLVVATGDDLPAVFVDERRARQALLNTLNNAIKFSPAGETVTLTGEYQQNLGHVLIRIVDNGIGMDEHDHRVALAFFGQVDNDLNRRFDGVGIGLPLSKSYLQAMGGDLTIDSKKDAGTTVVLTLPVKEPT